MQKAVLCAAPATSDMPPVGEDQAGTVGMVTAHTQVHGRGDSSNDAVTLAIGHIALQAICGG